MLGKKRNYNSIMQCIFEDGHFQLLQWFMRDLRYPQRKLEEFLRFSARCNLYYSIII